MAASKRGGGASSTRNPPGPDTSSRVASLAAKTLTSPAASKVAKTLAGAALANKRGSQTTKPARKGK